MSREQNIAKAKELRSEGLTYRAIAEHLGIEASTAYKWLNPKWAKAQARRNNARRSQAKREHERNNRSSCPDCGSPMGMGSGSPSHRPDRCVACARIDQARGQAERDARITRLWKGGYTLRQIANDLESTANAIGTAIARIRKEGGDLPYRRADRKAAA